MNVFVNKFEFFDAGETALHEVQYNFLNQNLRRRRSRSDANTETLVEPVRLDFSRGCNQVRGYAGALRNLNQAIRIGAVLSANDKNQIGLFRKNLDSRLTILCRVTDVGTWRTND